MRTAHAVRAVGSTWRRMGRTRGVSRRIITRPSPSHAVTPPVRPAAPVFFPLDEELALLPGDFTPTLVESMVRVGTQTPFERAAKELLHHFTKVHISEPT